MLYAMFVFIVSFFSVIIATVFLVVGVSQAPILFFAGVAGLVISLFAWAMYGDDL